MPNELFHVARTQRRRSGELKLIRTLGDFTTMITADPTRIHLESSQGPSYFTGYAQDAPIGVYHVRGSFGNSPTWVATATKIGIDAFIVTP